MFEEKSGEKDGQRRKRFLQYLRELPMPKGTFDEQEKKWVAEELSSREK